MQKGVYISLLWLSEAPIGACTHWSHGYVCKVCKVPLRGEMELWVLTKNKGPTIHFGQLIGNVTQLCGKHHLVFLDTDNSIYRFPMECQTANFSHLLARENVTVLWREEGYTMKYRLSPREIPRAEPEGFPEGSGDISSYTPTRVTIQSFSISSTSQYFPVLASWACNIFPYC